MKKCNFFHIIFIFIFITINSFGLSKKNGFNIDAQFGFFNNFYRSYTEKGILIKEVSKIQSTPVMLVGVSLTFPFLDRWQFSVGYKLGLNKLNTKN